MNISCCIVWMLILVSMGGVTRGHWISVHGNEIALSEGIEAPTCAHQQEDGRRYILICQHHWNITVQKLQHIVQMMHDE